MQPASPRGDAPAAVTNADDEDWYQLYFMNFGTCRNHTQSKYSCHPFFKDHENFITVDKESNENYVLSVIKQHVQNDDGTKSSQYRVIVWLKTGKEQHIVPVHGDDVLTATQLLGAVVPTLASKKPQLLHLPADTKEYQDLKEQLLQMEKEQNTHTFKFGVLYCKPGQSKDTEYFCNGMHSNVVAQKSHRSIEHGSPLLYEFMDTIASKIKLAGWSKFRGGLDAKENLTGPESYYSEFCGNEVMFHVSTMLPYVATDPQQLSRKRHIGNDIVTIIFVDEPDFKFNPTSVVSHFLRMQPMSSHPCFLTTFFFSFRRIHDRTATRDEGRLPPVPHQRGFQRLCTRLRPRSPVSSSDAQPQAAALVGPLQVYCCNLPYFFFSHLVFL